MKKWFLSYFLLELHSAVQENDKYKGDKNNDRAI